MSFWSKSCRLKKRENRNLLDFVVLYTVGSRHNPAFTDDWCTANMSHIFNVEADLPWELAHNCVLPTHNTRRLESYHQRECSPVKWWLNNQRWGSKCIRGYHASQGKSTDLGIRQVRSDLRGLIHLIPLLSDQVSVWCLRQSRRELRSPNHNRITVFFKVLGQHTLISHEWFLCYSRSEFKTYSFNKSQL